MVPFVAQRVICPGSLLGCHVVAEKGSPHLLAFSLATITDKQAERIGAIYLKKLLLLHLERGVALKKILLVPPHPHSPSKECGFDEQKKLTRAWAFASAYLVWYATPGEYSHKNTDVLAYTDRNSNLSQIYRHILCARL